MLKKTVILFLCLINHPFFPMKEDIIENNVINPPTKEKVSITVIFSNDKTPKTILIPKDVAEKIPLIKFLPHNNFLRLPFSQNALSNIIKIVESCLFLDDNKMMSESKQHWEFKNNKDLKIKALSSFQEPIRDLKGEANKNNIELKRAYLSSNNISVIRNLLANKSLHDRIEIILLASYLNIPPALIDQIIYSLELKFESINAFMDTEKYKGETGLCKKLQKNLLFFKKDYSAKELDFSWDKYNKVNYSVQFQPEGPFIALALGGDAINLWKFESNKKATKIKLPKHYYALNAVFNTAGTMLAIKSSYTNRYNIAMNLWSIGKEGVIDNKWNIGKEGMVDNKSKSIIANIDKYPMVFSSGDNYLYSIKKPKETKGIIIQFDVEKGIIEKKIKDPNALPEEESFCRIEYLPNNKKYDLVVASNKRLFFIDSKNQFFLKKSTGQDKILSLKFSSNTNILATAATDKSIKLWDITTYQCLCTLNGHEAPVSDIAFSPNGEFLVSGSLDKTIKFWDTMTGSCIRTIECDKEIAAVSYSSDAKTICVVYTNGDVSLISVSISEELTLSQVLFLAYYQEKKGHLSLSFKDIYEKLPFTIKNKIYKPRWLELKK